MIFENQAWLVGYWIKHKGQI